MMPMRIAIVVGSLLLSLAGRADAQPGMTPLPSTPEATPAPMPASAPAGSAEPLSEDLALWLSVGGSVGSWTLLIGALYLDLSDDQGDSLALSGIGAASVVLAPSLGHWYADTTFTRGMGLRAAGLVSVIYGGANMFNETSSHQELGRWLFLAGVGLMLGGTIDDMVTAPGRARRRNQELGLAVAPLATPHSAGLALAGRF
jgi:hypothetical protein